MKYMSEKAMEEIMRRSDQVKKRRNKRVCQVMAGASFALAALLILVLSRLPVQADGGVVGTVYGSFLLSAEAGGYVLATVLAFTLGVTVTILCVKLREQKALENDGAKKQEEQRKEEPVDERTKA